MIAGIFHEGSGLGNQLHRYVATRTIAENKGCRHGMMNVCNFKGSDFINLDWVSEASYIERPIFFNEKKFVENGTDIRGYDPEINFVEDNTVIDGEFQDPRYWDIEKVRKWLQVEPLKMPDDMCIIGFRGGEYKLFPDLYLPLEYYVQGMNIMREKYPNIRFEIHTDDTEEAGRFFSYLGIPIVHDIGINWRSVRYAKHLIIANSSFFIFPALLNEDVKEVIAPRYWARRNTKIWALPQNYYSKFTYI